MTSPDTPLILTDATFDAAVRDAAAPVLVDFWAPWCPPCRALAPTLDELARDLGGQAVVAKVDIDQNPRLVERFGISSIPTLVVLRDGEETDRVIGAASRADLEALLSAA